MVTDSFISPIPERQAGRMTEPEETAEMVYFFVSSKASYITGENYVIDGSNLRVVLEAA